MNFAYASKDRVWWSIIPGRAYGLMTIPGHAQAVPIGVDSRRSYMVVEAAPVVPREEDALLFQSGAAHHRRLMRLVTRTDRS